MSGCAWQEGGHGCGYQGVMSATTTGGGVWYCREHWWRLQGWQPDFVGNGMPGPNAGRQSSRAAGQPGRFLAMLEAYRQTGKIPTQEAVSDDDAIPF